MHKPKIDMIYLDMDGVIADFSKRYEELYKILPHEADKKKRFHYFFNDFIETKQFSTLDLMPNADLGLEFLRNLSIPIQILSSTASEERHDAISKQKLFWLNTHHITFNPIFVPGKRLKPKYATSTSIIIDDTKSVIDNWNKAGGIGILHKDWSTTIKTLKKYF